eukprot:1186814-Prorocentrum_minimum.AAC.1
MSANVQMRTRRAAPRLRRCGQRAGVSTRYECGRRSAIGPTHAGGARTIGQAGISAIRRLRKTDNNRIARACGATIMNRVEECTEASIGTRAGLFKVEKVGDEHFSFVVDCDDPKACSIILRGASKVTYDPRPVVLRGASGVTPPFPARRRQHPRVGRLRPSYTAQHTLRMPLVLFTFSRVLRRAWSPHLTDTSPSPLRPPPARRARAAAALITNMLKWALMVPLMVLMVLMVAQDVLNEVERNLTDAIGVTRNVALEPKLLPGGGACEMAVSKALQDKADQIEGVEQWPYRAVAVGLEVIPRTLAQNCGINVIRTLTKLRAKHAAEGNKCTTGINGHTGVIADMKELGVWEPYAVKAQTFKTAVEASSMLLRIDDIVSGGKKKGGASGPQGKSGPDEEVEVDSEMAINE